MSSGLAKSNGMGLGLVIGWNDKLMRVLRFFFAGVYVLTYIENRILLTEGFKKSKTCLR